MTDKMGVKQAMLIVEGELAGVLAAKRLIPADRRVVFDALAGNFAEAVDTLRAELDGLRAKSSRAYVAEQMRGLVAEHKALPDVYLASYHEARGHNACRAETLANIERWANLKDAP